MADCASGMTMIWLSPPHKLISALIEKKVEVACNECIDTHACLNMHILFILVTTTTFSFPERDTNSVVLGSDEGYLYKARIYDTPGTNMSDQYWQSSW